MPQKKKEKGAHQIKTSDIWRRTQKGNSPRTVTHDAQPGNRARTPAGKFRKATHRRGFPRTAAQQGGGAGKGLVRWVLWCIILVLPLAVGH